MTEKKHTQTEYVCPECGADLTNIRPAKHARTHWDPAILNKAGTQGADARYRELMDMDVTWCAERGD
jgi:predicted RNA-binding Zn-ribbon protein involved in translation (DUF1610 family)